MNLNGNLAVSLLDDFVPGLTDAFTVLTASSINGFFSNAPPDGNGIGELIFSDGHFVVTYNPGSVVLSQFVPEPSSAILLLLGLPAVSVERNRKRRKQETGVSRREGARAPGYWLSPLRG